MATGNERKSKEVLDKSGFAFGVMKSDSNRAFPIPLTDNLNLPIEIEAGNNNIGYIKPPSILATDTKSVTNAGTAESLAASISCREVIITANTDNTGYVYIGDVFVSSTRFMKKILADEEFSISIDDLSKIYLDVDTNGEGVTYGYLA